MTTRLAARRLMVAAAIVVVTSPMTGVSEAGDRLDGTTVPDDAAGSTEPSGPFCASIPTDGEGSFAGMADDPVATAASNNPYLTTLVSAVQAAGLADTLNGPGPFTVLAPNNEAFAAMPPADLDAVLADTGLLTHVLLFHVVQGVSLSSADLVAAGSVEVANGADLVFTADGTGAITINGDAASLTCSDITTQNATVHVIDAVLLPPPLVQVH